mmetsp:Transcript_4051/g.14205  ORF Transcript_4051/g.14205 Transcript_4051/m.14205 type:complete len:202 (-) Transcript_4051:538-1143(-)
MMTSPSDSTTRTHTHTHSLSLCDPTSGPADPVPEVGARIFEGLVDLHVVAFLVVRGLGLRRHAVHQGADVPRGLGSSWGRWGIAHLPDAIVVYAGVPGLHLGGHCSGRLCGVLGAGPGGRQLGPGLPQLTFCPLCLSPRLLELPLLLLQLLLDSLALHHRSLQLVHRLTLLLSEPLALLNEVAALAPAGRLRFSKLAPRLA